VTQLEMFGLTPLANAVTVRTPRGRETTMTDNSKESKTPSGSKPLSTSRVAAENRVGLRFLASVLLDDNELVLSSQTRAALLSLVGSLGGNDGS